MRFIGLALHDAVPDVKTIWLYRGSWPELAQSSGCLRSLTGYYGPRAGWPMGGQIGDATVIEARRPRLTQSEKDTIKGGGTLAEWTPVRCTQIDRDGRWTIKRGRKRQASPEEGHKRHVEIAVPMFGYKNHVGIDRQDGFVRRYGVTHAAAYDGQLSAVIDHENTASDV